MIPARPRSTVMRCRLVRRLLRGNIDSDDPNDVYLNLPDAALAALLRPSSATRTGRGGPRAPRARAARAIASPSPSRRAPETQLTFAAAMPPTPLGVAPSLRRHRAHEGADDRPDAIAERDEQQHAHPPRGGEQREDPTSSQRSRWFGARYGAASRRRPTLTLVLKGMGRGAQGQGTRFLGARALSRDRRQCTRCCSRAAWSRRRRRATFPAGAHDEPQHIAVTAATTSPTSAHFRSSKTWQAMARASWVNGRRSA